MDISILRHQSIIDPSKHTKMRINIIGVGATGSRVFMSLVELGFTNIHCYDPDHIEPHNLANQAFLSHQVGMDKVAGCKELYTLKTGGKAPATMEFKKLALPHPEEKLSGIVFILTDSMKSRREIAADLRNNMAIFQVFETRMASSYGNVLSFNPNLQNEFEAWEATLIDDGVAELSPCGTSISVGPTASIIANIAVWQLIHWFTDVEAMDSRINLFLKPMIVGCES